MTKLNVCARCCFVHDNKLLLVTNDESYWYLPGGHQGPNESLIDCASREVYEETGLKVTCHDVIYCSEFYDISIDSHKVEVIFQATASTELPMSWQDVDNSVSRAKFFSLQEMQSINVQPHYLRNGSWQKVRNDSSCYQGYESNE